MTDLPPHITFILVQVDGHEADLIPCADDLSEQNTVLSLGAWCDQRARPGSDIHVTKQAENLWSAQFTAANGTPVVAFAGVYTATKH